MGNSLSTIGQQDSTMTIICKLVTDNDGKFAGLAPVQFIDPAEDRAEALRFAATLVASVGKGFNPDHHNLKVPRVPTGAIDIGLHCSTHNFKFDGRVLTAKEVELIQNCTDTFELTINLKDFKVLVGSPSNDEATGVIGYVGLLITQESLPEYNRAVAVYGGKPRDGNIAHVSICGFDFKGFTSTSTARAAFRLVTMDGEKYPDGSNYYNGNVFPFMASPESQQ